MLFPLADEVLERPAVRSRGQGRPSTLRNRATRGSANRTTSRSLSRMAVTARVVPAQLWDADSWEVRGLQGGGEVMLCLVLLCLFIIPGVIYYVWVGSARSAPAVAAESLAAHPPGGPHNRFGDPSAAGRRT
jgi:hypothetical protein